MEKMKNQLKRDGEDLTTAPGMRLPNRPPFAGAALEDLRSGLGQKPQSKSKSKFKPATAGTSLQSKAGPSRHPASHSSAETGLGNRIALAKPDFVDLDEDEDELDGLTARPYPGDNARTSQKHAKPAANLKPSTSVTSNPRIGQSFSSNGLQHKDDYSNEEKYVDGNGTAHAYHPDYLPKKTLSELKFKKYKNDESRHKPRASSPRPTPLLSSEATAHVLKENSFRREPSTHRSGKSTAMGSPLSGKSANSNRRAASPSAPPQLSQTRTALTMEPVKPIPLKPSSRPKPRPVAKKPQPQSSQSSNKSSLGPASSQIRPSSSQLSMVVVAPSNKQRSRRGRSRSRRSRSRSTSRDSSIEIQERNPVPQVVKKSSPADFPFDHSLFSPTPPKAQIAAFPKLSPLRETSPHAGDRSSSSPKPQRPSRLPNPFPMSDLFKDGTSPAESTANTRRKISKAKGKQKKDSLFSDEEEDNNNVQECIYVSRKPKPDAKEKQKARSRKVKAFPMSTQVLESIVSPSAPSSSRSPSDESTRPGKRTSEGGSGDERTLKRSRKEIDALLQSPTRLPWEDEGDSMMLAPDVDPHTLCPYCDAPLPTDPSPLLRDILSATKKKSTRDPRPSNPLGLKASLAVYIAACQRHRFESEILPEADLKGWPKTIEWKKVAGRIARMKCSLKALIEDDGDDEMKDASSNEEDGEWEIVSSSRDRAKGRKKRGPKARSIFWAEVMEEVKQKGSRAATGVRGQFANFEKAQPGYYGELGSVIIHQTLYNLFPPSSMDPTHISPLSANEFVQRILVPEVALRLIMEDKGLDGEDGCEEALTILRESSAYGVAMFPEDGGEWGGSKKKGKKDDKMGVGDMIVMERAMKRRKELEEEEDMEDDERMMVSELEREAEEKESRSRRKGKPKADKPQSLPEPKPPPKPIPRPRPVAQGSSSMSVFGVRKRDEAPRRPPGDLRKHRRSMSRSHADNMDTDPASGFESAAELSASDSDYNHPTKPTLEERRRSPSASETRRQPSAKPNSTASANGFLADMTIQSESDSSAKAVVNGGRLARTRSRSAALRKKSPARNKMAVDVDDSDGSIEVVDDVTSKTPLQKRPVSEIEDDEDTPKAMPIAPLARAKLRKVQIQIQNQTPGPDSSNEVRKVVFLNSKPRAALPSKRGDSSTNNAPLRKGESFGWLLGSSQSQG